MFLWGQIICGCCRDCIRRGKRGEPVAIDTALGWVVSGPLGHLDVDEPVTALANFVSAEV